VLPRLVVITDWSRGADWLLPRLERALEPGPKVAVQHRHVGIDARTFLEEGRALASLCARFGNALFVNGRLDVALALNAHLHLPSRMPPVADFRKWLGPRRWVSVAVHDADEARQASGADLALVSPVFAPGSKRDDPRAPLGVEGYRRLQAALPCPAFALGGVTPASASTLPGADGFAAISGVLEAEAPADAVRALLAL
jgi:thiamine-phosphate pyrophosphorylase